MARLRFAVRVPAIGPAASVERLVETTQEAEALGFDAVMLTDHIHKSFEKHRSSPPASGRIGEPSNTEDPVHFEAIATLGFLAGITNRIELAVGVLALPLRDPAVLAKELATIDALSGGRLIVGVGVSNVTDKPEYAALRRPFLPYAERYRQIGEQVAAMRCIWEQEQASFRGDFVAFDDLVVFPKPAHRIPVWIGCGSLSRGPDHPAVRFALDHADGWLFPFLAEPGAVGGMVRDFQAIAAVAGRDLTGFQYCIQRRMAIGATESEARRNVDWVAGDQPDMWRWAGYMQAQGAAATATNIANVSIGTSDQIRQVVRDYATAGATMLEVVLAFATYDQLLAQMRLFGNEVLPAFR